jgi:hypothetical protein
MTTSHPTPETQPRDPSVDEFEAALIKARDAWQSKGTHSPRSTRPTSYSVHTTRHR